MQICKIKKIKNCIYDLVFGYSVLNDRWHPYIYRPSQTLCAEDVISLDSEAFCNHFWKMRNILLGFRDGSWKPIVYEHYNLHQTDIVLMGEGSDFKNILKR